MWFTHSADADACWRDALEEEDSGACSRSRPGSCYWPQRLRWLFSELKVH